MFEFLKNCDYETTLTEIKNHIERLNRGHEENQVLKFKFDIEKVNTLQRLLEWCLTEEIRNEEKEKFELK